MGKVQKLPDEFILDNQTGLIPFGNNQMDFSTMANLMLELRKQKMMEHFLEQFGNTLSEAMGPRTKETIFECPWCKKQRLILVPMVPLSSFYIDCESKKDFWDRPRKIKIEVSAQRDIVISRG